MIKETDSSLTPSSSVVGRRGRTKEKREDERSFKNRRCRTPGCILAGFSKMVSDGRMMGEASEKNFGGRM